MKHPASVFRMSMLASLLAIATCSSPVFAQSDSRSQITISSGASDVSTMDPYRATSVGDLGVVSELFDGLVRFPPGSADPKAFQPDLAEKWEASSDNKIWTFHLRKGVQFHGGYGELKASDVVYSIQRAADPKRSSFATNLAIVDKVEAPDAYTVRITLKYPDSAFLGRVSNYHGGYVVSKAAVEKLGDKFGQAPIGTGPFSFGEHVTQQYLKLVANDAYFRGKPKLAGITYRMIPSDSARDLAVTSGEIDIAVGKAEQRWVDRTSKREVKVDVFEPGELRTLFLNRSIKPLDNLKVRQAIAAAVNADELVRYAGKSVTGGGCSVVPNGYLGHDCSAGTYAYDITRAKALLTEAGFPNGFTITSIVSNISFQLPIMEIVQAQLAKAGIKLNMEVVDHATYQARSRQDQSAIVFYGAARFPTADYWLSEFYDSVAAIGAPKAMSNFSHCSVADDAIRKARTEPDAQKQIALWKQAQVQIHEDVCGIPLFSLKQVWARSDRVNLGYDLKGAMGLQPPVTEQTTVSRSAR